MYDFKGSVVIIFTVVVPNLYTIFLLKLSCVLFQCFLTLIILFVPKPNQTSPQQVVTHSYEYEFSDAGA